MCRSPKLIAACHVLHRLVSPRHPLIARNCLPTGFRFKISIRRARKIFLSFTRYDDELSKNLKNLYAENLTKPTQALKLATRLIRRQANFKIYF